MSFAIHGLLYAVLAAAPQSHDHAAAPMPQQDTVPLYDDLGTHHHAITTSSPRTQQYFDQGLRLTYGFNHAEAIASFEEALRSDPRCAMCYWGIALAYGPNINLPMDSASGAAAYEAARGAQTHAAQTTPVERALIRAIAARYGADPKAARAQHDSAYAREMAAAYTAHADDDDVATLYADALMNLSPWVYWTRALEPRPGTSGMIEALEAVSARNLEHAGACHLYIHVVEAAYPKRAEPCADRLAALMPGAGHIVHMPGHIYIRVGRFVDAIRANEHAIHADESFMEDRKPQGVYPLAYYPHNIHFLNFAALMADRPDIGLESATRLAEKSTLELQRTPGLGGFSQHYAQAPAFAALRFERWDDVLAQPMPPADLTYANGLLRYARGVAQARKGDAAGAQVEMEGLRAAAADPALAQLTILSYNTAADILGIASEVLAGEIATAQRNWDEAERRFGQAAEREDALIYIEPPEWVIPPRQNLARAQMLAGRHAAAQRTYEADLERFAENVWSLRGLKESLEKQGKTAEAEAVRGRIDKAMQGTTATGRRH
jgi:tetratricopeptide (TPR) repeat protein